MKAAARLALDAASVRGVTYADTRVVAIRNRSLTTKNGRVGHASESESLGIGVRVIAGGSWGFAASADLGRDAVEAAGARAGEI
jgi:TldD protein